MFDNLKSANYTVKNLKSTFGVSGRLDSEYYQKKYDRLFEKLSNFNIKKLKEIIFCWKNLFSEATENFEIEVLLDQNKEEYYIENHNKKEVVESLEKLIDLCNSAEKENKEIKCTKRTIKLGNIK